MGGGALHALKISIHGQVAKGMVGHGGWWTGVTCSRDKKQWSREGLEKRRFFRKRRGGEGGKGSRLAGCVWRVELERSKLDLLQKQSRLSPETAIGGGGGDINKKINIGGDDGGDDDGDEGDEGGLFRRRLVLKELLDRKFVDAVLNEW